MRLIVIMRLKQTGGIMNVTVDSLEVQMRVTGL
jgi:hypothetical protein